MRNGGRHSKHNCDVYLLQETSINMCAHSHHTIYHLSYLELQCCLAVGSWLLRPLTLGPGQVLPAWQRARQLLLQAGRQAGRQGQLASLGGRQLSTDLQE